MDTTVIVAIATGSCAVSLVLVKYVIQCLCPGHVDCTTKSGCNKPNKLNPLVTLQTLWEEKWNPAHEPLGKNQKYSSGDSHFSGNHRLFPI